MNRKVPHYFLVFSLSPTNLNAIKTPAIATIKYHIRCSVADSTQSVAVSGGGPNQQT